MISNPNPQLQRFLHQVSQDLPAATTAVAPTSTAPAEGTTAPTTAHVPAPPKPAANRQLKPEPSQATSQPKTPQEPAASTSKSSPTDSSTIITEFTPIDHTDPLPNAKHTLYFLQKRTPAQQEEALFSNPHYLTSLNDWADTLDSDDLTPSQKPLVPLLPQIKDLLQRGYQHYQSLAQQVSQLRATNNQLKEDNNRLSQLPHKDPAFSHLQQDHQELVNTFNELNQEYAQLQIEALELRSKAKERDTLQRNLQRLLSIFPDTTEYSTLERNIEELRNTEKHSNNLASALQASLEDWENVGKLLTPSSSHPFEAATKAAQLIDQNKKLTQQLNTLRSHHRRLSDTITKTRSPDNMPESSTTHATGMIQGDNLSPGNIRTFWEQVPAQYRNLSKGQNSPTTAVELLDALKNISCAHPRQAAIVLGNEDGTQEWDESLTQMDQLYNHECPEPEETSVPTSSRLFKASDVPTFKDDKDYDGFRGSLVSFLQSEDPPRRAEFGRALLRILSSIEAPSARIAAKNWNVQPLLRSTWEATYQQFLTALDKKFESQTILQDSKVAWLSCRPKEGEKPSDFFNRFEGLTAQLRDVQRRKGAPELSESIITERLLIVLPRYLTNNARIHFNQQGQLMELQSPDDLRKYFEITWTYTPRPAATGHETKSRFKTANASATPANQSINNVKERQCGMIASYDTSPAVPQEARGSLMPDSDPTKSAANVARRHYCAQHQLCLYCRRPRSQHQASAPRFKAVTTQNARPSPARLEQTPPFPEQLQIEAAPAPTN